MNNKRFLALIPFYHALFEVFMKVPENVDYLHRFYYKTVADSYSVITKILYINYSFII